MAHLTEEQDQIRAAIMKEIHELSANGSSMSIALGLIWEETQKILAERAARLSNTLDLAVSPKAVAKAVESATPAVALAAARKQGLFAAPATKSAQLKGVQPTPTAATTETNTTNLLKASA